MTARWLQAGLGVVVLALVGQTCARSTGKDTASAVVLGQVASSPRDGDVPSALADPADPRLPAPRVDPGEIIPGGPAPDGIPPLDHPRFERAGEVRWLHDREPVLALELGGEARAYPVQILTWHEIVNDTVAGIPVAVTYCPLCNSAIAYDRRLDDRVLDFGTSGRLYRSALVMYDRQTQSLWTHYRGEAVAGVLTGKSLPAYPVSTVSWTDFRRAHPKAWVLSRQTGFSRDYGRNPYPGYDDLDERPFLFGGMVDSRLAAMTRVVGIEREGEAVAVVTDSLARSRVLEVEIVRRPLVVWRKPGTASALDQGQVAGGRDVGAIGVFVPEVDGRRLHFRSEGDGFVDQETGTRWDVLGRAVSGALSGRSLSPVAHVDTFWFAWAAYLPKTRVVT